MEGTLHLKTDSVGRYVAEGAEVRRKGQNNWNAENIFWPDFRITNTSAPKNMEDDDTVFCLEVFDSKISSYKILQLGYLVLRRSAENSQQYERIGYLFVAQTDPVVQSNYYQTGITLL